MRRRPEKAKAPVIGPTEAFKVISQDVNQGIKMKDTAKPTLSQVCDSLQLCLRVQACTLTENLHLFPERRRAEIARLGSAMWNEVMAAKEEAVALEEAMNEPSFVAFKQKLIAKPKRTRKPKKSAVVLQLVPKRAMSAAEVRQWQQQNKVAA